MTAPPRGAGDLLQELLDHPLDAGYAEAAERRRAAGGADVAGPLPGWTLRILTAVGALLVGIVLAVAYRQEARLAPGQSSAHDLLVDQVRQARDHLGDLQSQAAALSEQVRREREAASGADPTQQAALTSLEAWSGDRAVRGPGITVTLADAAPSPSGSPTSSQRSGIPGSYPSTIIGDRELRDVVNALWAAGAEAISVNDIRITAVSTIRFAGQVVLIDFQPVTSPYEIKAIGNANAMDVAFLGGDLGARLSTMNSAGLIRFAARTAGSLDLPARAQAAPLYALPDPPGATGTPTAPPPGSAPTGSTPVSNAPTSPSTETTSNATSSPNPGGTR